MADEEKAGTMANVPLLIIPDKHPATVRVASDETESGYIVINESDFDRKVHKKYAEKASDKVE